MPLCILHFWTFLDSPTKCQYFQSSPQDMNESLKVSTANDHRANAKNMEKILSMPQNKSLQWTLLNRDTALLGPNSKSQN